MDVNFSFDQACEFIYCKNRDKPNYKDGVSLRTALNKAARRLAVADPATCQEIRRVVKAESISLGFLAKIVRGGLLPGGYQRLLLPDHYEKALSELTAGLTEASVVDVSVEPAIVEVASLAISTDNDDLSQTPVSPFESIRHSDEGQSNPELEEYWLARELQMLLGYEKWQNFEEAIHRAAQSFETYKAHYRLELSRGYHFTDLSKMIPTGKGAEREVKDYRLSRHACHLIAQAGDTNKPEIALAQAYFSIQTRRAELMDAGLTSIERTVEINKLITGITGLHDRAEVVEEGIERLEDQIGSLTNTFLSAVQGLTEQLDEMKRGANPSRVKHFPKPVRHKAAQYLYEFTKLNFPSTPGCDLVDRTLIVQANGTWINGCEFDHWDTSTICNKVINCVPMSRITHQRKHSPRADRELTEAEKSVIKEFLSFVKRREDEGGSGGYQIKLFA
jgi:hypothetical protein